VVGHVIERRFVEGREVEIFWGKGVRCKDVWWKKECPVAGVGTFSKGGSGGRTLCCVCVSNVHMYIRCTCKWLPFW